MATDEDGKKIPGQPELTKYRPYGQTRHNSELTTLTDYNFTDQELDRSTGLYNYDARLYNPDVAMFITADSLMPNIYNPQELNRYAYTINNPIKYVDPNGHESVGEMISEWAFNAATSGNTAEHVAATVVEAVWNLFGAESVSQVADSATGGDDADASDYAWAAVEVATAGSGAKAGNLIKKVAPKIAEVGEKAGKAVTNLVKGGSKVADDVVEAGAKQAAKETKKTASKTAKQVKRGAEKGKRAKKSGSADSHQQFEEISNAQSKVRQGKSNQIIESTEKSKQRADHDLSRINSLEDALDDWE